MVEGTEVAAQCIREIVSEVDMRRNADAREIALLSELNPDLAGAREVEYGTLPHDLQESMRTALSQNFGAQGFGTKEEALDWLGSNPRVTVEVRIGIQWCERPGDRENGIPGSFGAYAKFVVGRG